MTPYPNRRRYLMLCLMCITCFTALSSLAEEAAIEKVIPVKPGVTGVIERILADPHRNFHSVHGPDDCNSEGVYQDTREALGKYVAGPEENKAALKDYIFSGEAACNCTRAIVGKDIDILVKDLGMEMSGLPCL